VTFELIAGNLALDFANTVHSHGLPDPRDDLKTISDLAAWALQAGVWTERDGQLLLRKAGAAAGAVVLQHSRRLREMIYALFAGIASSGQPVPAALTAFNACVRDAMGRASVQKSGNKYELGCARGVAPLDRLRFEVTRSALELLTSGPPAATANAAGATCGHAGIAPRYAGSGSAMRSSTKQATALTSGFPSPRAIFSMVR
jgi:predicted RNA-binding Zn ribbon-like protein